MVQEFSQVTLSQATLSQVTLSQVTLSQVTSQVTPQATPQVASQTTLAPSKAGLPQSSAAMPMHSGESAREVLPDSLLPNSQFAIALFDIDRLRELSEGCVEFEIELLEIFVEDSQQHLDQLNRSLLSQNYGQFFHHAHHVKGSSANIGANGMRAIAEALEQFAQTQQKEALQDLLAKLDLALGQIAGLLQRMKGQAN